VRLEAQRRALLVVAALLAACGSDDVGAGARSAVAVDISQKARVLPKTGAVWGRDLALGLSLGDHELCRELDTLDCLNEAHRITLGGVEPARLGIDEPLDTTSVSAPIAADRVALSACSLRYERDASGVPVVFGPVLDAPTSSARSRAQVSEQLVERLLARAPNRDELAALEALYTELAGISDDRERDWAIGACMVVATSTEALFY